MNANTNRKRKPATTTIDLTLDDDDNDIEIINFTPAGRLGSLIPSKRPATGLAPPVHQVSSYNPPSNIRIPGKSQQQHNTSSQQRGQLPNKRPKVEDDGIEWVKTVLLPQRPVPVALRDPAASQRVPEKRRATSSTSIQEVIELVDDSSDDDLHVRNRNSKKPRLDLSTEASLSKRLASSVTFNTPSNENSITRTFVPERRRRSPTPDNAYFQIEDELLWKPIPRNPDRIEGEVQTRASKRKAAGIDSDSGSDDEGRALRPTLKRRPDITFPFPRPKPMPSKSFIWNLIRLAENVRHLRRDPPSSMRTSVRRYELEVEVDIQHLKITASFKECPGSISRIVQKEGWVVIGGACIGGGVDVEGDDVDPYNEPGSLITYNSGKGFRIQSPETHARKESNTIRKYYSVNDVKFDPDSFKFVSSGHDRKVLVVGQDEETGVYEKNMVELKRFDSVPHDLAFKPDSSVLAVAERAVSIFSHLEQGGNEDAKLPVVPSHLSRRHVIGAFRWGIGATDNFLFASSEPCPEDADHIFEGYHKGFDLVKDRVFCTFDAKEAGDSMVLHPSGDSLMLTTRGTENRNILRVYDVRRKDGKAKLELDLESYSPDFEAEVHDANFSPDGIYLALGRHDNETHVYDWRALSRGPVFRYRHRRDNKSPLESKACGIMKLDWLQSPVSRLGLLTGGCDGCVRVWDPLKAAEDANNGSVLVEVGHDIATFTLGDRYKGEHQLIVGDSTGEVTILDRLHVHDDGWK